MATVVNANEFRKLFDELGWPEGNVSELVEKIDATAIIEAEHVVVYLSALIAAPSGLNDQTVAGVPTNVAAALTTYFREKKLVAD